MGLRGRIFCGADSGRDDDGLFLLSFLSLRFCFCFCFDLLLLYHIALHDTTGVGNTMDGQGLNGVDLLGMVTRYDITIDGIYIIRLHCLDSILLSLIQYTI